MPFNGRWLFEHLEPFLRRMDRDAAFAALRECKQRGYISEQQLEALMAEWARREPKRAQEENHHAAEL